MRSVLKQALIWCKCCSTISAYFRYQQWRSLWTLLYIQIQCCAAHQKLFLKGEGAIYSNRKLKNKAQREASRNRKHKKLLQLFGEFGFTLTHHLIDLWAVNPVALLRHMAFWKTPPQPFAYHNWWGLGSECPSRLLNHNATPRQPISIHLKWSDIPNTSSIERARDSTHVFLTWFKSYRTKNFSEVHNDLKWNCCNWQFYGIVRRLFTS